MTPAAMRQLGRLCVGIAIAMLLFAMAGRLGFIPRLLPLNGVVIAALLISVVGRNLQRRAARTQA